MLLVVLLLLLVLEVLLVLLVLDLVLVLLVLLVLFMLLALLVLYLLLVLLVLEVLVAVSLFLQHLGVVEVVAVERMLAFRRELAVGAAVLERRKGVRQDMVVEALMGRARVSAERAR